MKTEAETSRNLCLILSTSENSRSKCRSDGTSSRTWSEFETKSLPSQTHTSTLRTANNNQEQPDILELGDQSIEEDAECDTHERQEDESDVCVPWLHDEVLVENDIHLYGYIGFDLADRR